MARQHCIRCLSASFRFGAEAVPLVGQATVGCGASGRVNAWDRSPPSVGAGRSPRNRRRQLIQGMRVYLQLVAHSLCAASRGPASRDFPAEYSARWEPLRAAFPRMVLFHDRGSGQRDQRIRFGNLHVTQHRIARSDAARGGCVSRQYRAAPLLFQHLPADRPCGASAFQGLRDAFLHDARHLRRRRALAGISALPPVSAARQ